MLDVVSGRPRMESRDEALIERDRRSTPFEKHGHFISVANMKGGVGKTTTVVSMAEAFAASDRNASILVVDIDPQASASVCLAGDDSLAGLIEEGLTLQDFLDARVVRKKRPVIGRHIYKNCQFTTHAGRKLDVSLLPCGPELRLLERQIIYEFTRAGFGLNAIEGQLWRIFEADFLPLRKDYDFVIFDCPPGISPFAEVAIRGSDMIVVPTIPDRISIYGLNAFCSRGWNCGVSTLPKPVQPHVLVTRMQNVKQHHDGIARLENEARERDGAFSLLCTRIPQSAPLANALINELAMPFTKKYSLPVAQLLERLVDEVKETVHADRR